MNLYIDGSLLIKLNSAAIGVYIVDDFSNPISEEFLLIDTVKYKQELKSLAANFIELMALELSLKQANEINIAGEKIKIFTDSNFVKVALTAILRNNYEKIQQFINRSTVIGNLVSSISNNVESLNCEIILINRRQNKKAHNLCVEALKDIRQNKKIADIRVEKLEEDIFVAINSIKGTRYRVDTKNMTCTCKYFSYENKKGNNSILCKHIYAAISEVNKY